MSDQQITEELRAFGTEVTRRRENAGLSQTRLAELINVTRSYIGQVESGRTRCRRDFTERLDKVLDTGTEIQDAWKELVRGCKYPAFFADFSKAEAKAALLRAYEPMQVYGLFQTEDYARVLLPDEEDLAARMSRQAILDRRPSPTVCVVLDESVLYRQVGDSRVMREQTAHLLELSERDNVLLQVAPMAYYRGAWGTFHIATQPDHREVAYTLGAFGGETSNDPKHVAAVAGIFVRLQAQALNVIDTRAFLKTVMEERWT